MRNCPRTDLGHDPYETNRSFDLLLGKTCRVRQCPVGLVTEKSRALIDLFLDCHTAVPGWTGTTYVLQCWPTSETLFDEYNLFVEAFRIIRNEISALQGETDPK